LYPRRRPDLASFPITATCNPARTVSGDYYDYELLGPNKLSIAVGDVAGKGISAALLMATIQSSLRTQLRHCLELSQAVCVSTVVAQLNKHLYAHTTPEKYATFFFGIFDEENGDFTYTNAGHLPPVLIRNSEAKLLDVNGMVVGAFPLAAYEESTLRLEKGDLLLFYTDGITEPENEYGEMFGEERLIEIVTRLADRSSEEIIREVFLAVEQWTFAPDSADDMTMLIARRA
jgi:sigma-B regulation protein RsbU (phosphoserine phosphatase)